MATKEKILFVGLACFDLVTVCDGYPVEDSDTRALDLEMRRGGNASNSSTCFMILLSWLKNRDPSKYRQVEVEFYGTMADDPGAAYMKSDFKSCGVLTSNVVVHNNTSSATAAVTINKNNGSRTIIHCIKDLPELTIADYEKLNIGEYDWIHLEARKNVNDIREFIQKVRREDKERKITISVEIEKPFESRTIFFEDDIDYLFVSKDYAKMKGATDLKTAIELLSNLSSTTKSTDQPTNIVVAWGEMGAAISTIKGSSIEYDYTEAFTPKSGVIDTTGAGDSFIAAVIFARILLNMNMKSSITFGCKFAGAKCGVMGNRGLENFDELI